MAGAVLLMISVHDVVYLYDMYEKPLRSVPVRHDLEAEHIHEDSSILKLKIPRNIDVIVEQQIIYREHRYVITEIEEIKSEQKTYIVAESLLIEMNDENVSKLDVTNQAIGAVATKILSKSKWTLGWVDIDEKQYSMLEENKSVLYLLRQLARLAGYYLEFDTLNRIVNIKKDVGKDLDFIFRYRKNIEEIKKKTFAPKVTVLYPYGRGGLTIGSVNNGKNYVEDFSWYESLGIPLAEARKRFSKTQIWQDDRFIYEGNLMREAQIKLRELAHPQISYETMATYIDRDVAVGDYGYIVDEELGIKVKVRIVRLVEHEQSWRNTVEFNYLIPGLHDSDTYDSGLSSTNNEASVVMVKNEAQVTLDSTYKLLLSMNITAFASTNAQAGFNLVGQASTNSLLDGYFEIDAIKVKEIKHVLNSGWNTVGVPFILSQIQDGSHELKFFAKVGSGTFSISTQNAEMYIVAQNLLGGMSSEMPKANVVEEVTYSSITVTDDVVVTKQTPIKRSKAETVEYSNLSVSEDINITLII